MSRTRLQTVGLLMVAAILGFGLVCGLCVGEAAADHHQEVQDCVLYKAASSGATGQLSMSISAPAPVALLALVSLALALVWAPVHRVARNPTPFETLSSSRRLAQLQTLLS